MCRAITLFDIIKCVPGAGQINMDHNCECQYCDLYNFTWKCSLMQFPLDKIDLVLQCAEQGNSNT